MNLRKRLKNLREDNRYSSRELANEAGTSHTQILNYEKGQKIPSPEDLTKMANVFGNTQQEREDLEFELYHLAGYLPMKIEKNVATHNTQLKINTNYQTGGGQTGHLQAFKPILPNLPSVGTEAGYTVLFIEAPAGTTLRVTSETKRYKNLHIQIMREGEILLAGVTDAHGDLDISAIKLKDGDIIQLDAPLQFVVDESVLHSF